jgi:hypothetical protein
MNHTANLVTIIALSFSSIHLQCSECHKSKASKEGVSDASGERLPRKRHKSNVSTPAQTPENPIEHVVFDLSQLLKPKDAENIAGEFAHKLIAQEDAGHLIRVKVKKTSSPQEERILYGLLCLPKDHQDSSSAITLMHRYTPERPSDPAKLVVASLRIPEKLCSPSGQYDRGVFSLLRDEEETATEYEVLLQTPTFIKSRISQYQSISQSGFLPWDNRVERDLPTIPLHRALMIDELIKKEPYPTTPEIRDGSIAILKGAIDAAGPYTSPLPYNTPVPHDLSYRYIEQRMAYLYRVGPRSIERPKLAIAPCDEAQRRAAEHELCITRKNMPAEWNEYSALIALGEKLKAWPQMFPSAPALRQLLPSS